MTKRKRVRPTRLPNWQEYAVYATLGTLIVTGLAWLALDQWVRVAGEFGAEKHPAEQLSLIIHGIAAHGFLIVAGALIPVHVVLGWNIGRNKASGLWLAIGSSIAAATGLGLYYLGGEWSRGAASLAHWLVGLVLIPALLIHAIRGRRAA